jgi:hypothetical protein
MSSTLPVSVIAILKNRSMRRIILYPIMTLLSVGVVGHIAMAQIARHRLNQELATPQILAALEKNNLVKVAQTTKEIDEKTALSLVWKLPLVQRKAKEIERLSKRTIKVAAIVDSYPSPNEPYYTIRIFEDDPNNHNYTIYWFRVFSSSGVIEALDIIENKYVSLDEWRGQIRRRR